MTIAPMSTSARTAPPLRGTQSFVAVMGIVWKRPGLLGLELLWRWAAGIPILLLAFWAGARALHGTAFDLAALQAITVFKPAAAATTLTRETGKILPPVIPVLRWLAPLGLLLWTAAGAVGRTAIWRRLDPSLYAKTATTGLIALTRTLGLTAVVAIWIWGIVAAGRYTVTAPTAAGLEPNLVLYTALAVGLTLLLFLLWSLTSWVLDAAPLFAMAEGKGLAASLGAALRSRPLRSKLIETNLVMGIVKVCLLVLAMVFSASPLPFESVESQNFLLLWWIFVAVLYLVASDLFHVVRRAAYLTLFRALTPLVADTTPASSRAS